MISLSFVRRVYGVGVCRKLAKLRAIDLRIQKDTSLPFAFVGAGMAQAMEAILLRRGIQAFQESYSNALELLRVASMKGQFGPASLFEWQREVNKPAQQKRSHGFGKKGIHSPYRQIQ